MACVIAAGERPYGRLYACLAVAGVMLGIAVALLWMRMYTIIVLVYIVSGILASTLVAAAALYMGFTSMYHNNFSNWLHDPENTKKYSPEEVRGLLELSKQCRRPAFMLAFFLGAVVSAGVVVVMVKEGAFESLLRVTW